MATATLALSPAAAVRSLVQRAGRWRKILSLMPRLGGWLLVAALGLNVLLAVLPILFMVGMSLVMTKFPGSDTAARGWGPVLPGLIVALGGFLLGQALRPFQTGVAEVVVRRIDGYCVDRLLTATTISAPLSALDQPKAMERLSDVKSAFDRAMPSPGDAVAGMLNLVARYGQLLTAAVLLAVVFSPLAALLTGVVALMVRFAQRGSLASFVEFWKSLAKLRQSTNYLRTAPIEAAGGKEARLLRVLPWFLARYRAETIDYLHIVWAERRRLLFWPFVRVTALAALGGCLAFVLVARHGLADRSDTLGIALALQLILIPMRFGVYFPESDVQTQYGLLAYQVLEEFESSAPPEAGSHTAPQQSAAAPEHAIRFENVTFTYPGTAKPTLQGLDVEIPAGRATAVVGLNGSGKTTFVKLLARVYEPQSGSISVDGNALGSIDLVGWRKQLAVVLQDFNRYELSLAANVGLGAPHRLGDLDGIRAALLRAGAEDVLAHGLDTPLSSQYAGGQDLSGGQWQRVALARALFAVDAGASVLVLDEPTSQLDVRAEIAFYDQFVNLTSGTTSVIISHRFSTVRRADHIVVFEDGRAAEAGNHDSLLRQGGRYAEMFHLQASRFEDAVGGMRGHSDD
jgi:ATP-binding cassette, subfamily B, bacterial